MGQRGQEGPAQTTLNLVRSETLTLGEGYGSEGELESGDAPWLWDSIAAEHQE